MRTTTSKTSSKGSRAPRKTGSLGPQLLPLLGRKGLRQSELARRTGMSPAQVCNFLQGQRDVHAATFVEILKILGIDVMKVVQNQTGLEVAAQRLQMLPGIERSTLAEFLKVYQSRASKSERARERGLK